MSRRTTLKPVSRRVRQSRSSTSSVVQSGDGEVHTNVTSKHVFLVVALRRPSIIKSSQVKQLLFWGRNSGFFLLEEFIERDEYLFVFFGGVACVIKRAAYGRSKITPLICHKQYGYKLQYV